MPKKLEYSQIIKTKFQEIREFKELIDESIENTDEEQYEYLLNIVFAKISVIETSINNLKKVFLERLNNEL